MDEAEAAPEAPPPMVTHYTNGDMYRIKGWANLPTLVVPDVNTPKNVFHVAIRGAGGAVNAWRQRLQDQCGYTADQANGVRSRADFARIFIRQCPFR